MTTNAVVHLVSVGMQERLLAAARIEEVREPWLFVLSKRRMVDHFADFLLKNSEVMQLQGMLQNPVLFLEALDPELFRLEDLGELNERMQGLGETRNLALSHDDAERIAGRLAALPSDVSELRQRWVEVFPGFDYDPVPEIERAVETLTRWMGMINERRVGVLRIRG